MMIENLTIALQITLIGMGVVFASLIVLALMMAALVRLTAERPVPAAPPIDEPVPSSADLAKVAAVAVAVAQAQRRSHPTVPPMPPTAQVSAWQSVMRGRQLKQRGAIR